MHAEQALVFTLRNKVRTAHIGRQHGFFNHPVRHVTGTRNDLFNAAVFVADDLRFGGFKVHRATLLPGLQQCLEYPMQVQQVVHPVLALDRLGSFGVAQNGSHFGVGEARMAPHHSRVKLVSVDLTVLGDEHVADHAQTLYFGVQRTQAVGQLLGQHGNHAAREIHTGGAVVGVHIDRATRLHVMADIGNGHQQAPALGGTAATAFGMGFAIDGIVKIARVLTVNGDQRNIGQINAVDLVLWPHRIRQSPGQRYTALGEDMRHAVFAHGDLNFHSRVIHLTQDFLDTPDGLTEQCGRLDQFNHDHLPRLGHAGGALGYQYVLAIALVFGCYQPDATFLQQAPDDGLGGSFDNFHDPALRTPFAVAADNAHLDPVLVQHGTHFIGG